MDAWLGGRLSREGAFALMGVLLGAARDHPARARARTRGRSAPARVDPQGVLAPLVRAAGEEWDVGIARAACFLAALAVALLAAWSLRRRGLAGVGRHGAGRVRGAGAAGALDAAAGRACATPPSRGSTPTTRPTRSSWAGSCCSTARTPTAHDYRFSGMERFYTRDGIDLRAGARARGVARALRLLPGHRGRRRGLAAGALAVRRLPRVRAADDARRASPRRWRSGRRCRGGSRSALLIAANPIAVRSAWFGQNDAPVDHADGAGLRAGHPRALPLGRRVAGGRRAAEAVRRGRDPVPGADDGEAGRRRAPSSSAAPRCSPG